MTAAAPAIASPDSGVEPRGLVNSELEAISAELRRWPWEDMRWTLPFVGFLLYFWSITSYQAPIGTVTMAMALLTLPFAKEQVKIGPLVGTLIAFFAVAAVGWELSQWKMYTGEEFTLLVKYVAITMVAVSVLSSRRRLRFFMLFYAFLFGLYPVRGTLFNYFVYQATTFGRASWNGSFANANELSTLMFFPLALSLGALATEKRKVIKQFALAGVCIVVLVLFLAQSRGALLALFAGAGLMFMRRKKGRAAMIGGAVAVTLVVAIFAPSDVWKRMGSITAAAGSGNLKAANDMGSAEQRMAIWKVAASVAKDNLAVGAGWAGYPFEHVYRSKSSEYDRTARGMRDAHSTYFTLLAEVGLPGTLIYMMMFVLTAVKSRRARKKLQPVLPERSLQLLYLEIAMVCFLIAAVFDTVLLLTFTYLQLAITYALAEQGERDADAIMRAGGIPPHAALQAA